MATFILPQANTVLLTDTKATAGVLGIRGKSFGTMLSRGATRLLKEEWFGESSQVAVGDIEVFRAARPASLRAVPLEPEKIAGFVQMAEGLALADTSPRPQPVSERRTRANEAMSLPGIPQFRVPAGRVLTRRIGRVTVMLHEASESLPRTVPIIEELLAIDASISQLPSEMMISRAAAVAGNKCAGCSGCSVCAACVLCAEVNFSVGAVSFVGLAGLAGLSGAIIIDTPTTLF